jgi:hypothetical protein
VSTCGTVPAHVDVEHTPACSSPAASRTSVDGEPVDALDDAPELGTTSFAQPQTESTALTTRKSLIVTTSLPKIDGRPPEKPKWPSVTP